MTIFLKNQKRIYSFLSGGFLGAILLLRPSEWFLVAIVGFFFCMYVFMSREKRFQNIGLFLLACVLPVGVMLLLNTQTYGAPFLFGYNFQTKLFGTATDSSIFTSVALLFFPFGIHASRMMSSAMKYIFLSFWWIMPFSLGSIVWHIGHLGKMKKALRAYLILFMTLSLYLWAYYGSWDFQDTLGNQISLGDSHVRYWLFIFIFALPFFVHFLQLLFRTKWMVAGIAILFINVYFTLLVGPESLISLSKRMREYASISQEVQTNTSEESIIISRYHDKIVFPERSVVVVSEYNEDFFNSIDTLANTYPLYILDWLSESDQKKYADHLVQRKSILDIPLYEVVSHSSINIL